MISIEKLEKLYDGVIDGISLTTKKLNEYGFNSMDIKKLIDDKIIERVKRGYFHFIDINNLLCYGKKLCTLDKRERANLCFSKCHEIDPDNLSACFQLFIGSIQDRNYEKAFELFDKLSYSKNEFYNIDSNFHLYLLNYITDVPEKYREQARFIKYSDVKIPENDKRGSDILSYNRVRSNAMKGKFTFAYKLLNEIVKKNGEYTVQDVIEKCLLGHVIMAEEKSRKYVNYLVKEKRYEEIIQYYDDKRQKHNLNTMEECIARLSEEYLKIKKTSTIPKPKLNDINNLFEAIDANRFDLALNYNLEFNNQHNINNEENATYNILCDICELINYLKNSNLKEKENIKSIDIPTTRKALENKQLDIDLLSINSSLIDNDIDLASTKIKDYLKKVGKDEYEYIITNLIKLSIVKKDISFIEPMLELSFMINDDYQFNTTSYIQKFYLALSKSKFDEAEILLNIINKAFKITNESVYTDGLYMVLEKYKEKNNLQNNSSFSDSTEILVTGENTYDTSDNNIGKVKQLDNDNYEKNGDTKDDKYISINQVDRDYEDAEEYEYFDQEDDSYEKYDHTNQEKRDKEFVEKQHKKLLNDKGIIILNTMAEGREKFIIDQADRYLDMSVFTIMDHGKKRIVLKYNDLDYEDFDEKILISEALDDYRNGNYEDCLNKEIKILETSTDQKSANYSLIGLSYMKLFKIDEAIKYLTVANYLAKQENSGKDFGDLLLRLRDEIDYDDIKPRVKMRQSDFINDNVNFYGIKDFDKINEYICESGLDVETACQNLNMTEEDIDIVKLIYAREYYTLGNKEKGELFLKSFERSKEKTNKTIKIYNYIQKSKKFYKSRFEGTPRQLSLKLIPHK